MTRPAPGALAAGFREALDRLEREASSSPAGRLHVATSFLPPEVDPLRAWHAAPADAFAAFWETDRETLAGIGVTASGVPDARFGTRTPRWLGGVPFATDWSDADWAPFLEAGFVLPRWTLHRGAADESVKVSLAVRGPLGDGDFDRIEEEYRRIVEAVVERHGDGPGNRGDRGGAMSRLGLRAGSAPPDLWFARQVWEETVRTALTEIEAGRLEKVVLARRVAVPLPAGLTAVDVIDRLRVEEAGRFRFGLRREGRAFVGASPECLFRKRGNSVEVEALAGTFDLDSDRAGSDGGGAAGTPGDDLIRAAEHLFASGKDLEEHALVVRGVVEALESLALSVVPDEWPEVREARRLAHLSTTVRAHLPRGVDALDLVSALHPTPAVGGLPREAAMRFIRRNEPAPRGLFAAPIGWIDSAGNACLAVGIRSALLLESHAWVYAGAGIVAASQPEGEWDETTAKLRWFGELVGRGP